MKVVLTGGGSGGHITPLLAVAHQLKLLQPEATIIYIGQRGDTLGDIPAKDANIDVSYTVKAGKFRRYHGEGFRQFLDVPTALKNTRDAWFVVVGLLQSWRLLRKLRPDVVFVKGGFVGGPVGLAAAWLHIPFVTHDSDALPGLANRIIARWAVIHAVALPKEVYQYPASKTVTVGVPIAHAFRPLSATKQRETLARLGLNRFKKVLLITGGGLGAQRLNEAAVTGARELLERYPDLVVVHLTGRAQEADVNKRYDVLLSGDERLRVIVKGFIGNLYDFSGVASVVVTRAGGTSMAEFAAQGKACVVVPNPLLTGGHQLKNAKVLAERKAVLLVDERELKEDPKALLKPIQKLLDNPDEAYALGKQLTTLARPDAARKLAVVLLEQAKKR